MENTQLETFATMSFSFIMGLAERKLHNESKMLTIGPDGVKTKTDSTKRMEIVVAEIHRMWDAWNGMEG